MKKYKDLIEFEPIRTVIQLQKANQADHARQLVSTFVISEQINEVLRDIVFPQLQFAIPSDNKGLLIVGNYGTGKSHLMAVISAVAERADLVDQLTLDSVKESCQGLAGRFIVYRTELATQLDLDVWLLTVLQQFITGLGIDFQFPPADQVVNLTQTMTEMMGAFEKKYPEKGLLLVIDELLDYLRALDDQKKTRCFNVLRVLGEFCEGSRFRFIAGVQESLFDSPSFAYAADSLRRVQARFEQVYIQKQDIEYVVEKRLLQKSPEQKSWIRAHLEKFVGLYDRMSENMNGFVDLFPVHPRYIEIFSQIRVAERREVLRTLSDTIEDILDQLVPEQEPGLISYDSYWKRLSQTPAFKAQPEIRTVIEKSGILEDRILSNFQAERRYQLGLPIASRVVQALSIHRLTTVDSTSQIGLTAAQLRDDLCLWLQTPKQTSEFLENIIGSTLQNMFRVVGGELLGRNTDNNQYFLRLEGIDPMAKIEERMETLSPDQIDQAYFTLLTDLMECTESTYRPSFKIWEHSLMWEEKRVERLGYLFMGAPNERSTTQPEREFYLYFLAKQNPILFEDELLADEVFFQIDNQADCQELDQYLTVYAAAKYLSDRSSSGLKVIYNNKGLEARQKAALWLKENMGTVILVKYKGQIASLSHSATVSRGQDDSFKAVINRVASKQLGAHLIDKFPDYPRFSIPVTQRNRRSYAEDVLNYLTGGLKTNTVSAVLEALGLLNSEGSSISIGQSVYAQSFLDQIQQLSEGQVINRNQILLGEVGAEVNEHGLEPDWVAIVILCMVYVGEIEITTKKSKSVNAGSLSGSLDWPDIVEFRHIRKSRGFPEAQLVKLFDLLQLPSGLIKVEINREDGIRQLQAYLSTDIPHLVELEANINQAVFWQTSLIAEDQWQQKMADLQSWQTFLESLKVYNTLGKLRQFSYSIDQIEEQKLRFETVAQLQTLMDLVNSLASDISYLELAANILPDSHFWQAEAQHVRQLVLQKIGQSSNLDADQAEIRRQTATLKPSYQLHYVKLHNQARLSLEADQRKANLMADARLKQLRSLQSLAFLPIQQLRTFESDLASLKTCIHLVSESISTSPQCPECSFRPREETTSGDVEQVLDQLEKQLGILYEEWTQTLLENLEDPTVEENINLLDQKQQASIKKFIDKQKLPEPVDETFVQAITNALQSLERVDIPTVDLIEDLQKGGMPCSIEDFKERFENLLSQKTVGKTVEKIRIILSKREE